MELEGKAIIVVGAAGGLGSEITAAFVREGAIVAAIDRDIAALEVLARRASGAIVPIAADLCDISSLNSAISAAHAALGTCNGLVNSAMWISYAPIEEIEAADCDRMLAIGLRATILATRSAIPAMTAGGSIINMSSPASQIGIAHAAVYSAVKGGINAFTRQAAVELGPRAIRVNAILPGATPTPGSNRVVDEKGWEQRRARTPLGRLSQPSDIADLAVFLASDRSRCLTGETIRVDGGMTINGL